MDPSSSRSAARLAVPVLLALLVSGCADQTATSTAASTTAAPTTTVAPTTTTVPPLNAKELAWLKGVSAVRTKVENSFQAKGPVSLTRAIVLESSRQLAS
jgi:PBP1b-binding outer membrane lipoprotein LpoB